MLLVGLISGGTRWLLAVLAVTNVLLLLAVMRMMGSQIQGSAGIQQKLEELLSRFDGRVCSSRRKQ